MNYFRLLVVLVVMGTFAVPLSAQELTPAQKRKSADASVDRNILFPSAETVNKGDLTINSYELFLLGLTYGITDDLQVSATTLLPILTDFPFVLALAGKWQFVDTGKILVSVQPNFMFMAQDGNSLGGFGAGIAADFILDDGGKYVVSVSESNLMLFGDIGSGGVLTDGFAFTLAGAFSARVARIVKLLAEVSLPGALNWNTGDFEVVPEGALFSYGVRFFGETIAVDLSFLRPLHPDMDPGNFIMGFPYLTFSARF